MNTNSLIRIHDGTELSVLPNLRLMNETRQELKEQTLPEILLLVLTHPENVVLQPIHRI